MIVVALVVVVVVELTQISEDDLQKCYCWKADELITVGAWV